MERIDEGRLDSDLEYRCKYLMGFMGFGEEDIAVIHGAAPLLGPMVPAVVDAVYVKLHTYDATWRHFLPRQHGHEGESAMSMEELTLDHPQIAFRKKHLDSYLEALVTRPYDKKMLLYLDMVGKIHTTKAGNDSISVPLIQMNALMGYVPDVLNAAIMEADIPLEAKTKAIRAFSKLLWIQAASSRATTPTATRPRDRLHRAVTARRTPRSIRALERRTKERKSWTHQTLPIACGRTHATDSRARSTSSNWRTKSRACVRKRTRGATATARRACSTALG